MKNLCLLILITGLVLCAAQNTAADEPSKTPLKTEQKENKDKDQEVKQIPDCP